MSLEDAVVVGLFLVGFESGMSLERGNRDDHDYLFSQEQGSGEPVVRRLGRVSRAERSDSRGPNFYLQPEQLEREWVDALERGQGGEIGLRMATVVAGAATVLLLSAIGASILTVMLGHDDQAQDMVVTVPAVDSSTSLSLSDGSSSSVSSVVGTPLDQQRISIVTFQAAGGQVVASGTVPSLEVYERISSSLFEGYGQENVVVSGITIDDTVATTLWMESIEDLFLSLLSFDDYRIRFDGDTLTGYVGGGVEFDTASANLPAGYIGILEIIGAVMQLDPTLYLLVEGHTDSDGDDTFNLDLSQQRADAVVAYFSSIGIQSDRLIAAGRGESNPTAPNDSPEGRARNRRVGMTLSPIRPTL